MAGTAGLAGCFDSSGQTTEDGSTGDGTDGGTTTEGGASIADDTLDYPAGRPATDVQFNRYSLGNYAHTLQDQLFEEVARGYADGTVRPDLLEDMTVDGRTLTLTFPEGFKWWNGDDLTAEDYYIGLEIDRLQSPEQSPIESNTLVDDYTIERTFKTAVSPNLMKANVAETFVNTPRSIYREYLTRYEEASNESERESVTSDLLDMSITTQQLIDEGLGNALYRVTGFNSSETVLEKFEDHPYASRTDVPNVRIIPETTSDVESLSVNDQLDMNPDVLMSESQQSRYPDNIENVYRLNWFRTQKFTFNFKNEHIARLPVRRAIVNAVDFESMVAAMRQAGTVGAPAENQTALRSTIHEEYLGSDFVDQLIDYPVGKDLETATQLLEDAGYTKENGTWVDPDGESFTFTVLTQNNNTQVQATKVFNDHLNAFGIQTEISTVSSTDYYQRLQTYEADIFWIWHVAKALWHPTAYFSNNFYGIEVGDPSSGNETGPTGKPFTTTIPSEVGATEISGSGKEIQPAQLMNDLPNSESAEQVRERTRDLVQWFNYALPDFVFVEEDSGYWGDTQDFSMPTGDDYELNTNRPGEFSFKNGWISSNSQ
ncbi:ABC transporter substrate-binding protein [Haloferax volcanii]|uniref:Peptide ABC transporter substrate-binding protein n=2 Tax=Haloferax volcanii TaxID=2246 RepID=L9VI02_HALVD|nr:ABC transporter substrate-binding protein [Haloferax volcanii]ELY36739.1 peptide ABC transporter substrate-binding protein [Haloferax volcanii DS2]MBS8118175.1 ABC transporter substrate-binding protein [Haloferax volcanii]MBS8123187.1 ABC transporter substrate-binding protein [Haloferax volcanii]MBS8127055.1 ABC transporter substrate-binding protein [Haloferax volcanii]MBS8130921.1 ABC transporter substrate-binding protein [Haloferax volcanii]